MDPAWIGAAIAALAVLLPRGWRLSRQIVTIVHEAGHALVAVLTGRRVRAVRLHRDTSGITESIGRPFGPGMIGTALAGYVAPPLLGTLVMLLVLAGRSSWAWWLLFVILAGMLLVVRTWFGLLVLLAATGAVWLLQTQSTDPRWAETAGFAIAWVLVGGGLRSSLELWRHPRRGVSDPELLAQLTVLPAWLWRAMFTLAAALCLSVSWLGVMGH